MHGALQECGPRWIGLFAGYGVHGSGACRTLCVEAEFRHCSQPRHLLAPSLSTDREQQQQHILTPAPAKAALAQHPAHHWSICGAARHTHRHAHACARTHTHTNTHVHANRNRRAHAHTHAHAQTQTHACVKIYTQKHTGTHTHVHVARVMGFANFSASLATLSHLSLPEQHVFVFVFLPQSH